MKIQVWSDYVCPFCYIGKRELEIALKETGFASQAEVEFKAYQLDPNTPVGIEETMHEALAKKYGTTPDAMNQQFDGITARAAEVGLEYHFDKMHPENTFKAHRLAKYAATVGKEKEMTERLLYAHFTENKRIGDKAVLVALAKEVGLEEDAVKAALQDERFAAETLVDMQEAQQIGVRGVPFFVINDKYAISGAQPNDVFTKAIQQVAEEENLKPALKMFGDDSASCDGDNCQI